MGCLVPGQYQWSFRWSLLWRHAGNRRRQPTLTTGGWMLAPTLTGAFCLLGCVDTSFRCPREEQLSSHVVWHRRPASFLDGRQRTHGLPSSLQPYVERRVRSPTMATLLGLIGKPKIRASGRSCQRLLLRHFLLRFIISRLQDAAPAIPRLHFFSHCIFLMFCC